MTDLKNAQLASPDGASAEERPVEGGSLPLAEERLVVDKVVHERRLRISTRTVEREAEINEMLTSVSTEVTRVPVDRVVDAIPAIEERDGVTVIPVFEEVLVRQIVLKEELHVRRVSESKPFQQTVSLRSQEPVAEFLDPVPSEED